MDKINVITMRALALMDTLQAVGVASKGIQSKTINKGQRQELEMFANAIKQSGEWAIPLWQQVQAMEIAFEVEAKKRWI